MAKGTFRLIGDAYRLSARNVFQYCRPRAFLLKPFLYPYALFWWVILSVCALGFSFLVIFDHLARFVDAIRRRLLGGIESSSARAGDSFGKFLLNPLGIALLTPLFILSALIPKLSSLVELDVVTGTAFDAVEEHRYGAFRKISAATTGAMSSLFRYVQRRTLILWPVLLPIYLANCVLLLLLLLICTPLLLLDLFSYIVDAIRSWCVRTAQNLGNATQHSFRDFLFGPAMLVCLTPIFLLALLIPKFSTGLDGGS